MQIREVFQQTYLAENTEQFEGLLNSWYYWATHSQLAPIIKVAKTIKNHWEGVISWKESQINNGILEGLNSVLQAATGAPCYLTKFRDSCRLNSFTYAANGRCPERPASVTTTHKSRFVITPSNGWTAIRNAILASLARYRALRLSELPCRLSGTKNHHFASAPFP